ncbi:MAG: hypothetical protein GY744_06965 [Gammaproteobacteria bacterium]|nr:hypothetical protein [Gammaproteobacteria bacterium]
MDFRHSARINESHEIQIPKKQILYLDIPPDSRFEGHTGKFDVFDGEYSTKIEKDGVVIFEVSDVEFSLNAPNLITVSISAYAKESSSIQQSSAPLISKIIFLQPIHPSVFPPTIYFHPML